MNEKQKEGFLTVLATVVKNDPKTFIRKHANELKVHKKKKKKTVSSAIKQNLSPDHNPLCYTISNVLENKTNATSHRNVGSLKTAIEEEKNKKPEEFILKACTSFRSRLDTII